MLLQSIQAYNTWENPRENRLGGLLYLFNEKRIDLRQNEVTVTMFDTRQERLLIHKNIVRIRRKLEEASTLEQGPEHRAW